ncbi:MAG: serpin family protein [Nocardioides sp.]
MTSAAPVQALLSRLWQRLPEGNLTLSPHSVAVALAMAACGARGDTLAEMLPEVVASLAPADVTLTLPRWTVRTALDLAAALRDAGMPTAFTGRDRGGRGDRRGDAHDRRLRRAPDPIDVVVDRPFLFVLHDLTQGTPLFVGRVVDPRG